MATHSSILAWEIPGTEPGRLQSMGMQESDTTSWLNNKTRPILCKGRNTILLSYLSTEHSSEGFYEALNKLWDPGEER